MYMYEKQAVLCKFNRNIFDKKSDTSFPLYFDFFLSVIQLYF